MRQSMLLVDGTDAFGARDDAQGTFTMRLSDITRPLISEISPLNHAKNVPPAAKVTATFSEPMSAKTLRDTGVLRSTTFTLHRRTTDGTTIRVAATVAYNATTKKAVLDPANDLRPGATYVATTKGGANGASDLAGNPLRRDRMWGFTAR